MQRGQIVHQRLEPRPLGRARRAVDEKRRAHLDDDAAEPGEKGDHAGPDRTVRVARHGPHRRGLSRREPRARRHRRTQRVTSLRDSPKGHRSPTQRVAGLDSWGARIVSSKSMRDQRPSGRQRSPLWAWDRPGVRAMLTIVCEKPHLLSAQERPVPVRGPDEVLVRIRRVGVCGTDLHIFEGNQPYLSYPRVMGHELAGVAEAVPPGCAVSPGEIVYLIPYLSCGHCNACRQGKANCCRTLEVLGVHRDGGMATM